MLFPLSERAFFVCIYVSELFDRGASVSFAISNWSSYTKQFCETLPLFLLCTTAMRTIFGISEKKEVDTILPTGCIKTAVQDVVDILLKQQPQLISLIRKEFRSLTQEVALWGDISCLQTIADHCKIPVHIVHEFFAHLQHIGYIPWCAIEVSDSSREGIQLYAPETTPEQIIKTLQMNVVYHEDDVHALVKFLYSLGSLPGIRKLGKAGITKEHMPRWLFRTISLNDMDYARFPTIQSYLSFILLNCKEQQRLFGDQYADLLVENWGIPVDDIPEKQTTILSPEKWVMSIKQLEFQGETYPLHIRIVPWYSPVWIDIVLWIDFPTDTWINNQNYFVVVGIQFEQHGWTIVPVIHTIQQSPHNIGADAQGRLIPIQEPFDNDKLLSRSQRLSLMDAVTKLFVNTATLRETIETHLASFGFSSFLQSHLPQWVNKKFAWKRISAESRDQSVDTITNELINTQYDPWLSLAYTSCCYLFAQWYTKVQIIAPEENRRLTNHNHTRTDSLKNSMYNLYTKKWLLLGGNIVAWWRVEIMPHQVLSKELLSDPVSLKHIEISSLVTASLDLFKKPGAGQKESTTVTHQEQHLGKLFALKRSWRSLST